MVLSAYTQPYLSHNCNNKVCTVPYGFISCTDENDDDVSVQLCRLISKKLNNNSRLKKLKEDF